MRRRGTGPGVKISFTDAGYKVSVARRGYNAQFLEEMEPPYQDQSLARRRGALAFMRGSALLHVPILLKSRRESLRYDLVLIAKERDAP